MLSLSLSLYCRTLRHCGRILWPKRVNYTHACGKFRNSCCCSHSSYFQAIISTFAIATEKSESNLKMLLLFYAFHFHFLHSSRLWLFLNFLLLLLLLFWLVFFSRFVYSLLRLGPNLWRQRQCLASTIHIYSICYMDIYLRYSLCMYRAYNLH